MYWSYHWHLPCLLIIKQKFGKTCYVRVHHIYYAFTATRHLKEEHRKQGATLLLCMLSINQRIPWSSSFQVPEFSRILDLRCWSIPVILKLTGASLKACIYHRHSFFMLLFYITGEIVSEPTTSALGGGCVVSIDVGVDAGWGKSEIFLQIHAPFWAYKEPCRTEPVWLAHLALRNTGPASAQDVAYSLFSIYTVSQYF